jgi:uncharacterized protein (DUF2267 family)
VADTPPRDDRRESTDEHRPLAGESRDGPLAGESGDEPQPSANASTEAGRPARGDAAESTDTRRRDADRGAIFETFTGAVRRQLVLADDTEGTRVTRAVLTTLAERVDDDTARTVAAPLPAEIQLLFVRADSGQTFDYQTFLRRVAARADTTPETAEYHTMVVLEQAAEVAPHPTLARLRDALPAAYDGLFTLVDTPEEEA